MKPTLTTKASRITNCIAVFARFRRSKFTCRPNFGEISQSMAEILLIPGRVANPRPEIKTGLVSQPITDADDETGRDRSCIATRPRFLKTNVRHVVILFPVSIFAFVSSSACHSALCICTQISFKSDNPR